MYLKVNVQSRIVKLFVKMRSIVRKTVEKKKI